MTLTALRKSRREQKIRFVNSHDSTYMLTPREFMFQVNENNEHGFKILIPNYYRALNRAQIRKMFLSNKLQGKIGQYRYDKRNLTVSDGRLQIGCQVFVGANIKGLKAWAGVPRG